MHSSAAHRFIWGIIIVTIGVIFLLNSTGTTNISIGEVISVYWPVLLILFGLQGTIIQGKNIFWWYPLMVIIGFMFLGRNMGWFEWQLSDIIRFIGPIALILFGISMIFRGNHPRKRKESKQQEQWNPITPPLPEAPPIPPGPPPAPPELDEFERRNEYQPPEPIRVEQDPAQLRSNSFHHYGWKQRHEHKDWWKAQDWNHQRRDNHSRFIGDIHIGHDYWELRPMSISNFIGDTTLDLTKAQIPEGETRIYVSSFIGDVKVYSPNDLGVGLQVISSCLIGDVKVLDQTRGGLFNQMSVETPHYADTDKRVVLIVSSFIGDVRVTKVG
jgi:lia operon protein LiaF